MLSSLHRARKLTLPHSLLINSLNCYRSRHGLTQHVGLARALHKRNVAIWSWKQQEDYEENEIPHNNHVIKLAENGGYMSQLISNTTTLPMEDRLCYSRTTFEAFLHEAAVTSSISDTSRIVDQPDHCGKMDVWLDLLLFRRRLHGHAGVHDIWKGLLRRGLRLSVQGHVADALWTALISSAHASPGMLEELYAHATSLRSKGSEWHGLYTTMIGTLLRQQPSLVLSWHTRLKDDGFMPATPAAAVIDHAVHSEHPVDAFHAFIELYNCTNASGLYDQCVSALLQLRNIAAVQAWHEFLVARRDLPSPNMQAEPEVMKLFAHSDFGYNGHISINIAGPAKAQRRQSVDMPSFLDTTPRPFQHNINDVTGSVEDNKQKAMGDAFCARLVATSAFSVETVFNGLRLLGLETIGPLALRELAARSEAPAEFLRVLRVIKEHKFGVVKTTFTRALCKLAEDGDDELFRSIVLSDQHSDAYEDRGLQEQLYFLMLERGKQLEARVILAVMTMDEPDTNHTKWRMHLERAIRQRRRFDVAKILQEMRACQAPVGDALIDAIFHHFLRPRRPGMRPPYIAHSDMKDLDDLEFVTKTCLDILRAGNPIRLTRWRELFRRFGMLNKWTDMERLCSWLATWYSPLTETRIRRHLTMIDRQQSVDDVLPNVSEQRLGLFYEHPLSIIFDEHLLRALVAWGFKDQLHQPKSRSSTKHVLGSQDFEEYELGSQGKAVIAAEEVEGTLTASTSQSMSNLHSWDRGLVLALKLRKLGVYFSTSILRKEVRARLWILYGPARLFRQTSRTLRRDNRLSLYDHVKHIEHVWKGSFFNLPPGLLDIGPAAETELYVAVFGVRKRLGRRRNRRSVDVRRLVNTKAARTDISSSHLAESRQIVGGCGTVWRSVNIPQITVASRSAFEYHPGPATIDLKVETTDSAQSDGSVRWGSTFAQAPGRRRM